ncbi:MAG: 50S ribosomal protein L4 [Phycisphaerae bacterium]
MLEVPIYNESGQQVGSEPIDEALLGGRVNASLLKQASVRYAANRRQGTVAQKTRAEVEGSSRKLFKQKGTGNARRGNLRTPVMRGGGRAFPRKPRDFGKDMPKKMRRLARNQAVLAKIQSQDAAIIDALRFEQPKTKRFATMLAKLSADRGCVVATDGKNELLWKSGRNIPRTQVMDVAELNAYAILQRRKLVFTREAFQRFRDKILNAAAGA